MTAPSNNSWRIAGALGIDPDPTDSSQQEVMTQGLGFPLRPVSGVPKTSAPDIPTEIIAEGLPVQWMGPYVQGVYYAAGAYVTDGQWAAIANKTTLDKPAPEIAPDDPATYGLPAFTPATQSSSSVVTTGNRVVFSQDGWVKELRVWVPTVGAGIAYRVVLTDLTDPASPITTTINLATLTAGVWTSVGQLNTILSIGAEWTFVLEALNSSTSTLISGSWLYDSSLQTGSPDPNSWSVDTFQNVFRIAKIDLADGDRSAELLSVLPTSTLRVQQTDTLANLWQYTINEVSDGGDYVEYLVTLTGEGGRGPDNESITTVEITIPVALLTDYSEEVGGLAVLPSWASSSEGSLTLDGVDQGVPVTNAYGVDILFQPAVVSDDWDIVSYAGD